MKKPLILLVLVTLLLSAASCKKTVENQQKNIIIEAMTTGVWFVYQYTEAGTDVTAGFSGYEFKFDQNGTVTGTLAATSTAGTWSANITNYSITSQFPSAGDPLQKLNGTWIIKDSYLDFVKAEMTTASGTNQLQLQKKP